MSTTRSLRVTCALGLAGLLLFTNSYAQDEAAPVKNDALPRWTIGGHIGANMSNLILGKPSINDGNSFGYGCNGGVSLEYGANNLLSVVAEGNFLYATCVRNETQPLLSDNPLQAGNPITLYANYKKTQVVNYIQVPVMARLNFGSKIRYYVNAGPYLGLVTYGNVEAKGSSYLYLDANGRVPYSENGSLHDLSSTKDFTTKLNTLDFGVTGGFGGGYTMGRHGIWIDARYNIGLTNIWGNSEVNGQNQLESFMLGVGYTYAIVK